MSDLSDFAHSVPGFFKMSGVDQLLAFAWFVEARRGRDGFDGAYMRKCFQEAGLQPPDVSKYLPRLAGKKPPQLVKVAGNRYKLGAAQRRTLDARLGADPTVVAI